MDSMHPYQTNLKPLPPSLIKSTELYFKLLKLEHLKSSEK